MANTFEFIGKIVPCKETDSFKPYEKRTFDSGWAKTTLKFNVVCDTNRHFLEVGVLTPANLESATIYTATKGSENSDGTRAKGKKIQVSFADRNKPEIIESVANFKKFVVDTEVYGRRQQLEYAIDKFKEGSITDEQMKTLGVSTLEECQAAYEKSKKKHHEFIWEYDFIEFLNELVNKPEIKDVLWRITGTYELEYSDKNNQWYRKFKPQRIYRAVDDAVAKSQGTFNVVFSANAVDDNDFEETGKLHINGYIGQYLGKPYKKVCYAPMAFTVDGSADEMANKRALGFEKKFTFPDDYEGEYREIGVVCDIIDGAQTVELTEDMLTDEQKENLEFGLITMDDIKKELGKPVYGDRVTDIVIIGLARGFSGGSQETILEAKDVEKVSFELDVEDVFDIDDDDDEI